MAQPDRRLVPIVSLDVVGYSRLAEINERQTLRLVQRVYDRLVARSIGRYGGKVFKTMGDGLLAEFQSVVAAIEWVSDMQRELHERKLRVPGGGYFQVPAGVVLPFDNLSGEADQAYFADAVVEEITATLSRIRDFFVIARNSAFSYKGRSVDVRQVGRELGVRYAVEGSEQHNNKQKQNTAQLV